MTWVDPGTVLSRDARTGQMPSLGGVIRMFVGSKWCLNGYRKINYYARDDSLYPNVFVNFCPKTEKGR